MGFDILAGHVFRHNYIHDIHVGSTSTNPDPHADCFQTWDWPTYGGPAHDVLFDSNYCSNFEQGTSSQGKGWEMSGTVYNLTMINNVMITNFLVMPTMELAITLSF